MSAPKAATSCAHRWSPGHDAIIRPKQIGASEHDVVLEARLHSLPPASGRGREVPDDVRTQPVVAVPHRPLLDLDDQHGRVGEHSLGAAKHAARCTLDVDPHRRAPTALFGEVSVERRRRNSHRLEARLVPARSSRRAAAVGAGRPPWVSRTWNVTSPGASLRARCSYRIGSSSNFAANALVRVRIRLERGDRVDPGQSATARTEADASLAPASTNRSTPVNSTRSKNSSTSSDPVASRCSGVTPVIVEERRRRPVPGDRPASAAGSRAPSTRRTATGRHATC